MLASEDDPVAADGWHPAVPLYCPLGCNAGLIYAPRELRDAVLYAYTNNEPLGSHRVAAALARGVTPEALYLVTGVSPEAMAAYFEALEAT